MESSRAVHDNLTPPGREVNQQYFQIMQYFSSIYDLFCYESRHISLSLTDLSVDPEQIVIIRLLIASWDGGTIAMSVT